MVLNDVHNLAAAYQRISGPVLATMKQVHPLNYAVLSADPSAVQEYLDNSHCCRTSKEQQARATWKKKQLTKEVTLQQALLEIERVNSETPLLFKIQLNFTNGSHATFVRAEPLQPATLSCSSMYNANAAFTESTSNHVTMRRTEKGAKLEFIVDDKGRSLKPNAGRPSSFSREVLFRNSPAPFVTKPGYAFTPMSSLTYQVRPATTIAGARPGLRDASPKAVEHRPRIISRPTSPNFYEPIDERNRMTPALAGSRGRVRPQPTAVTAEA